jgi:hypothetical protein
VEGKGEEGKGRGKREREKGEGKKDILNFEIFYILFFLLGP